jgi:hypothetical protein
MTASLEPLTSKQWLVTIGLLCIILAPMVLALASREHSPMRQHFGALAFVTIIAELIVPLSKRTWIPKIK